MLSQVLKLQGRLVPFVISDLGFRICLRPLAALWLPQSSPAEIVLAGKSRPYDACPFFYKSGRRLSPQSRVSQDNQGQKCLFPSSLLAIRPPAII